MRKGIILGIGIFIILLALAATGSAHSSFGFSCGYCHTGFPTPLTANGIFFNNTHKFDGVVVPADATSCTRCHVNPITNMSMTSNGSFYTSTHRYNATILASEMLAPPACGNCHAAVSTNNFARLSGTPYYVTSATCNACHPAKYNDWKKTLHAVMLTPADKAQAANVPLPGGYSWPEISYVLMTKFQFSYINTTGYWLAQNDTYNTETQTFGQVEFNSSINYTGTNGYGTCGRCHTTGWNGSARNISLPGINGTFEEPGIACERCHGPAGNGHQVAVNYSGNLCTECHMTTSSSHKTGWENGAHAPPLNASTNTCSLSCHSPFDSYKNNAVTSVNATNVACGVCHNTHDITDSKYLSGPFDGNTWANVSDAKLSYFNATASKAAKTDIFDQLFSPVSLFPGIDSRKDPSYGNAPINVVGPVSGVLCSQCHYEHGLAKIAGANLTHSRINEPQSNWATCTDCHMQGTNSTVTRLDMMKFHANNPLLDVSKSCGGTTKCHITSAQNLSASAYSIVPVQREWKATAHNDRETGIDRNPNSSFYRSINGTTGTVTINSRYNSCNKCHSPIDWNPATDSVTTNVKLPSDYKGIVCAVCHNIHDMGDWINKTGKVYGWYNRDAIQLSATEYQANYTVENITDLCGNCHSNDNARIYRSGPGWNKTTDTTPISPHGMPAKDIFVGSWKQSSVLKFECIDCHMYANKTDGTGTFLNDSDKITGHSFAVNATGLQNESRCKGCHDGTSFGNVSTVIDDIQTGTHDKWNSTNITVMNALNNINGYTGEKNLSRNMIAQAYWKIRMVSSDSSWGVHDPVGTKKLLDEASALAIGANQSLGRGNTTAKLYAGWNIATLNETPANTTPISVMSSVSGNLTVVWSLNASTQNWTMYNPARPVDMNTLTKMNKGESYLIKVTNISIWVV